MFQVDGISCGSLSGAQISPVSMAYGSVSTNLFNSSPQSSPSRSSCKKRIHRHGESFPSVAGVSMAAISSMLETVAVKGTDWLLDLETASSSSGGHGLRKLRLLGGLCWSRHFGWYVKGNVDGYSVEGIQS